MFTNAQIETLRTEFADAPERISFAHADRMIDLLNKVQKLGGLKAMKQLADADIRFVSLTAAGRVLRWGK